MAQTQIALLRGINVGKAKRVAMADLRALLGRLGCRDVRTLLNSGNAVFAAPEGVRGARAMEATIETALERELGVPAATIVLGAAELARIVRENPLLDVADDPSRLLVAVWRRPADKKRLEPLTRRAWTPDALGLGSRAAYLWCAAGVLKSPLSQAAAKAWGATATTRNWATVLKLDALARGDA